MAQPTKPNDLQLILLSTASQRDHGSLLPPAGSVQDQQERIRRMIPPLLRRGLLEEMTVSDTAQAWREQDETLFGVRITDGGRAAIGVSAASASRHSAQTPDDGCRAHPAPPRAGSKAASVLALLRRDTGATIGELIEATGWMPHTTRAALSGLRKRGHAVLREQRGDKTCYRIAEAG